MSAPVAPPQGPPPTSMDSLVAALGNAAERVAEKAAGANDPGAAKDYGSAALSFTQALMLIVAPHTQPPQGGGPQNGSQGATGP